MKETHEQYAKWVIGWLYEILLNNTDNEEFSRYLEIIIERAEYGLANYFNDQQEFKINIRR